MSETYPFKTHSLNGVRFLLHRGAPALLGHEPLHSGRRFMCVSAQLAATETYLLGFDLWLGFFSGPDHLLAFHVLGGFGFRQHCLKICACVFLYAFWKMILFGVNSFCCCKPQQTNAPECYLDI
ncbi:MAG: hypothetical protein ACUVXA_10775 [Candidatus Jordarchaeum sp.]|uniref:hypothetical protein n=1 Tax=Candidatus Jordarchaeum sp. TaxID=2823881 RepID=UPI004049192F